MVDKSPAREHTSAMIEGRLVEFENEPCIANPEIIYFLDGFVTAFAYTLGCNGDKFIRLTIEEIDGKSSRSGLIRY